MHNPTSNTIQTISRSFSILEASGHISSWHCSVRFWLFSICIAHSLTHSSTRMQALCSEKEKRSKPNSRGNAMKSNRILRSDDSLLWCFFSFPSDCRSSGSASTHVLRSISMSLYYEQPTASKHENRKTFVRIDGKQKTTSKFPPIVFWLPYLSFNVLLLKEIYITRNDMLVYLIISRIHYFVCFFWNRLSSFVTSWIHISWHWKLWVSKFFSRFFVRSEVWANEQVRMNGDKEVFVM